MRRTRRCATTIVSEVARIAGSTPRSYMRDTAPMALFVCSVLSTMWPVMDAWNAISAVSRSRVSPTRMTSGSCRRIDRSALAKVSPAFGLICTWLMPANWYSIGSSTVTMLTSGLWCQARRAYSVVVLPEPVGPVTRIMPCGWLIDDWRIASWGTSSPSAEMSGALAPPRTRSTIFSPKCVGSVDTRRSMERPW